MKLRIFFSWQSEKPQISDFIRDTLTHVCQELSAEYNLEIEVADASDGQRGSYNINAAVVRGINDADIIVVDLTATNISADGNRGLPNANALFEYAYGCGVRGFENVVAAVDIDQMPIGQMPFDWNHNSVATFKGLNDKNFSISLKSELAKIIKTRLRPVLTLPTTTFFSLRIAESFPKVSGFQIIDDPHMIKMHLGYLFKNPIVFGEATDREGDPEPIWWFRGGSAMAITCYKALKTGTYIIGWDEYRIKRIAVYESPGQYYSEYVYIETEGLPPIDKEYYTKERIQHNTECFGYCDEEYAVFNGHPISHKEYDNGVAEIDGEHVEIAGMAEVRIRHLSPYNFVVCAKFSSINSPEFDMQSRPIFDGILKGTSTIEDLHQLIISLPKPPYRGRR